MKSVTEKARAWGGQEYDLEGNLVDTDKTIGFIAGSTKYINKATKAFCKVYCKCGCEGEELCPRMDKCTGYNKFMEAIFKD